ncbi:unnamed protein product [Acanthoscelides obtectus]|uniref:C2H2-type domain-containing protein n=1 Tax=Acanthoscelides obtectus TaxID=200917 RepID=A0A9P0JSI1_ACAOB|nr:unnamed protein product [Acanthoscelides obtectus]CAK1625498.1 hypothetical protein AOBTE_LOCUS3197 [Acanthoscelides obtectus]
MDTAYNAILKDLRNIDKTIYEKATTNFTKPGSPATLNKLAAEDSGANEVPLTASEEEGEDHQSFLGEEDPLATFPDEGNGGEEDYCPTLSPSFANVDDFNECSNQDSDSGVATDALSTSDIDALTGPGCDFLDTASSASTAATGSSGGESPNQPTATASDDNTHPAGDRDAAVFGGESDGSSGASASPLPPPSSATPSPVVRTPPADAPTTYPKIRIKTTGLLKESASESLTITEITDDNPDGDPNRGQNSMWSSPSLEDPLKLPEGDDNNLISLFNNNDSRAKDLGFHSSDSEFISLDRLEDRNRGAMTLYNPGTSQQNALESLTGLPMQALAQQVSRLQPSGSNGMHQQNVLINIQQFPSGPPQPQYQPPPMYPPPHHYPPQPMHQPYQYQPPNPMYYPPAPHGYPPHPQPPPPHMGPPPPPQQMQHQQPPPMGGQQPPHQQHQPQQPMPLPAPPVSQHQQTQQQGPQQQYRPPQPQAAGPGMGGPRPQGQQPGQPRPPQMGQRMPNARPMGPRQSMPRQRAPMNVRPRMGAPGAPGGMVRPGAGMRPRGPAPANGIRPTGQSPVKRPPQANNQAEMQTKKKRFDLLTPDKDDEDCQVICMQPKNTDGGLPQIESVQGGTEQAESSIMHLSDSITLSVRNPPPKPVVQEPKKSDAKAVANILATRGITVTASAKPKEKPPETAGGGQKQQLPASLNLNGAVSIIPAANKANGHPKPQSESLPTVDLTDDSSPAAPAPQQLSPNSPQKQRAGLPYRCDLCPATYPNALGLSKHRQTYHKTTGGMCELGIPLINLKQPGVVQKLSSLGINSFIPMPSSGPEGTFALPVINTRNAGNVAAIGATSMLTLGPVRTIRPQMANGSKPPANAQKSQ